MSGMLQLRRLPKSAVTSATMHHEGLVHNSSGRAPEREHTLEVGHAETGGGIPALL